MSGRTRREESPRLLEYERRSALPMIVAGAAFLVIYSVQVLAVGLPAWATQTLEVSNLLVWAVFVVDLVVRVRLARQSVRYLARHPVDVASVLLPVLRPLRLLRVFTAGNRFFSGPGGAGLLQTTQGVVVAVALLLLMGALAVLDAERGVPGATITSFGEALWWAGATVTTVGYGDVYPVTGVGRAAAGARMVLGISLVGVITATVAGWMVEQSEDYETDERQRLEQRLDSLLAEIRRLNARLDERDRTGSP